MDRKEFKKVLTKVLSDYGFKYKSNKYSLTTEDLIIIIEAQKSNFDNSFYVNFGFLIKSLSSNLTITKNIQCDVFGRLTFSINETNYNSIDIEAIDSDEFSVALRKCLDEKIGPVLEFGLKKYFELNPMAINTSTLRAREYLGK